MALYQQSCRRGAREIDQYDQLLALTNGLVKRGLKIAIFHDSKLAVTWLAGHNLASVGAKTSDQNSDRGFRSSFWLA